MRQQQFLDVVDCDEAHRRFDAKTASLCPKLRSVPLAEAWNQILATTVESPSDVPGFDRSNVDGFAVRAEDTYGATDFQPIRLRRTPTAVAMGRLSSVAVERGEAMSIPTGGALPRGADSVVMVEHTRLDGDEVVISKAATPGQRVTYAGTDVARGEVILVRGTRLTSRETGVLAATGVSQVDIIAPPCVAILSTGDELVDASADALPGQIYDCNAVMLADAVRECGGAPISMGIIADDPSALEAAISQAIGRAEVVLLSGGTSKGPGDVNVRALEAVIGADGIVVHGVALKPGKPLCLAATESNAFAVLPGFPTSAIFTFHEFIAPLIRRLANRPEPSSLRCTARVPFAVRSEIGRTEFALTRLMTRSDEEATVVALPIGKGSGSVTTWSHADGYFVIPREVEMLDDNEIVEVRSLGYADPAPADLVIVGSQCVGVDILIDALLQRGIRCRFIAAGSQGGLSALERGECDVATSHLFDPETETYNRAFLPEGAEILGGYGRMQGVVFRKTETRFDGRSAEDAFATAAGAPDLAMVNRNRGSGTRIWIDRLLGGARPPGYGIEASTHQAVAAAIAQGRADYGVAIHAVAKDRDLGFIPLTEERFELIVAKHHRAPVDALRRALLDPEVQQRLAARGLSGPFDAQ